MPHMAFYLTYNEPVLNHRGRYKVRDGIGDPLLIFHRECGEHGERNTVGSDVLGNWEIAFLVPQLQVGFL